MEFAEVQGAGVFEIGFKVKGQKLKVKRVHRCGLFFWEYRRGRRKRAENAESALCNLRILCALCDTP